MRVWFTICISVLLMPAACAPKFTVKSDPLDAEVFVLDEKSGEKKSIGKTPLELPMSSVKESAGTSDSGQFFTIVVAKAGYQTEKMSIPTSRFGTLVTELDLKLKNGPEQEARLAKDVLNSLFLAQKFAIARQFDRAQIEVDKVLTSFPDFPRALTMRGSIYYMQKNYAESLKWYEAALKADPQLEDAAKMSARVRQLQGGKGASR